MGHPHIFCLPDDAESGELPTLCISMARGGTVSHYCAGMTAKVFVVFFAIFADKILATKNFFVGGGMCNVT